MQFLAKTLRVCFTVGRCHSRHMRGLHSYIGHTVPLMVAQPQIPIMPDTRAASHRCHDTHLLTQFTQLELVLHTSVYRRVRHRKRLVDLCSTTT